MKKILLITDQWPHSKESAIEGLFKKKLAKFFDIDIVYFDKNANGVFLRGNELIVPWICRRHGLLKELSKYIDVASYNFIVVRNFFSVLRQVLKVKNRKKIGFWETFPHTFRRYEEACISGRGRFRKFLEYKIKNWQEINLLSACDFYWPITDKHKELFRPGLIVPFLAVPMGVDPDILPEIIPPENKTGPIRFVYVGTIDSLRNNEIVHKAFLASKNNYILEYYSSSRNAVVDFIKKNTDPRIHFFDGVPREELLLRIREADFGVCFLPEIKTYIASSPTKAMEYMALGLRYFGNDVGQYPEIIREKICYVKFSYDEILSSLDELLKNEREGENGRVVFDYGLHAEKICSFLNVL